jgi:tetratricopeptide (TPR) repeat protein
LNIDSRGSALSFFLPALGAALLVTLVYWPAVHASFVWDDVLDFEKTAWLRHGNDWLHYIMRGFNNWSSYFRPLVVALFTLEVRTFDARPGPMHGVSIILHLINMVLVGIYAKKLSFGKSPNANQWYMMVLPMLLYGLHPVLIEPVTWIGCQFDLTATLFILLGLILNVWIKRTWIRAVCVTLCFFLAACSKESAIAFPLLLLLSDWFDPDVARYRSVPEQFRQLLRLHWVVYALAFAAGAFYLVLRHTALGTLVPTFGNEHWSLFAHVREVSFLYVHYWHMLFWPMDGMSPVHPVPLEHFSSVNASSIFNIILSAGIILIGLLCTLRRYYVGGLIAAVTFALLPVLHVLPVGYDQSLYHERYAMPALAMACAWLPMTLLSIPISAKLHRVISTSGFVAAALWLALGAMNVRATIPLWSTPLNLWQWAYSKYPNAIEVEDALIGTYIDLGYDNKAWGVIDRVIANNVPCTNCMLNAAELAISENKLDRAAFFLDQIKNAPDLYDNKVMSRFYLTMRGQLELLQGDAIQAEKSARGAIGLDNLDPNSQLLLAMALATQGKLDEANRVENTAVALSAPDERDERRSLFENWLKRIQANPTLK